MGGSTLWSCGRGRARAAGERERGQGRKGVWWRRMREAWVVRGARGRWGRGVRAREEVRGRGRGWSEGSGWSDASVELLDAFAFLLADVIEDEARDSPLGLLGGDVGAVLGDAAVEELEGVARLVHLVEGVDEVLSCDILGEEVDEGEVRGALGAAGAEASGAEVVEHGAGPVEAFDEGLLVEAGFLEEGAGFLEEGVSEFGGEEEFEGDSLLLEELGVEHGPDEGSHSAGVSADEGGFVDAVHEDEEAGVTEASEDGAEALEEVEADFLGVVGGKSGGIAGEGWEASEGAGETGGGACGDADLSSEAVADASPVEG